MRKLFIVPLLILAIGLSATLSAQELKMEIYNSSGDLIENGANLFSIGGQSSKTMQTDSLFVKNISDATINLKVRRVDYNVINGSFNVFTALAQSMSADETLTPNYWQLESGLTTPTEAYFVGSYYPQTILGTSSIIYSFLSVDENDQVLDSVYVTYAYSNTSLTPYNVDGQALYNQEILINCDPTLVNEYPVNLYNHTELGISVRVNKAVNELEDGQSVYFKFGGVEYSPDDNSSDGNGVAIAGGQTLEGDNGFVAMFNANGVDGNEFLTKVTYRFFNKIAGNDADYVTFIYNPSGVGFNDLDAYLISKAYPNPAVDYFTVEYQLPKFKQSSLKVYQVNGSLVGVFPIVEGKGSLTVSTEKLSAGTYFYTIEIDGKPLGVEKLIVR